MASSTLPMFICIALMCLVVGAPHAEGSITCSAVTENLAPCVAYLRTGAGPPRTCCTGVQTLKTIAVTIDDRKTACRCMKSAASAISGLKPENVAALPGKCGVSIPGTIGSQIDCSQVE